MPSRFRVKRSAASIGVPLIESCLGATVSVGTQGSRYRARPDMNTIIDSLLNRYSEADASDFGALALAVIVFCWFVSRYFND